MSEKTSKDKIIKLISQKSTTKQKVFSNTKEAFLLLKEVLQEITLEYNEKLKKIDTKIMLVYKDRGAFEAELKVAGDLLIFNMHSNVFEFDREHGVWKISYVQSDKLGSYSGIINMYNFLSDSFKYNRLNDLGYLIGRLFINKDKHFFMEGKRELGFLYNDFGNSVLQKKEMKEIIESAILYILDFDLLVPHYENVKIVSVQQMKDRINKHKIQTGKRLGFKFYADSDEIK